MINFLKQILEPIKNDEGLKVLFVEALSNQHDLHDCKSGDGCTDCVYYQDILNYLIQ